MIQVWNFFDKEKGSRYKTAFLMAGNTGFEPAVQYYRTTV